MAKLGSELETTKIGDTSINPAPEAGQIEPIALSSQATADFTAILPLDVLFLIFSSLNPRDLKSISCVNRIANNAGCKVQNSRYRRLFSSSMLWAFLPVIAQNTPESGGVKFIEYVLRNTLFSFNNDELARISTVSGLWLSLFHGQQQIPKEWIGIPINSTDAFSSLAMVLIRYQESEKDFSSSQLSERDVFHLWRVYHDLECSLSTVLLFYECATFSRRVEAQMSYVSKLFESPLVRWLTGSHLVTLNRFSAGIFTDTIRLAIELRSMNEKQAKSQLYKIERILAQLTEEDLLNYLSPLNMLSVSQIFSEVIQHNYELILNKFSVDLIFRLLTPRHFQYEEKERVLPHRRIQRDRDPASRRSFFQAEGGISMLPRRHTQPKRKQFVFCNSEIASQILSNSILTKKLNSNQLVQVLAELDPQNIGAVCKNNHHLRSVLTFDILNDWLNDDPLTSANIANFILTYRECFPRLVEEHFNFFETRLDRNYNKHNISNYKPYCKLRKMVASNPDLETPGLYDDVTWLADAINALNSHLLYKAICNNHDLTYHVICNYLYKFDNSDLIIFTKNCISSLDQFPKFGMLFEKLSVALEERTNALQSSHWLELTLIHREIAVIIANKYLTKLDHSDLNRFARAYLNDVEITNAVIREHSRRDNKVNIQEEAEQRGVRHYISTFWSSYIAPPLEDSHEEEAAEEEVLENLDNAIRSAYLGK